MSDRTSFAFAKRVRSFWRAPMAWTQLLWAEHLMRSGEARAERGLALMKRATQKLEGLGIGVPPAE